MNGGQQGAEHSALRCAERASEEYRLAGNDFPTDYTRQDAAVLNITRACEQAIDLANHLIKTYKMGIPVSSAESFSLLAMKHVIPASLEERMRSMVGFRNIAFHEYRQLNIDIIGAVIRTGLTICGPLSTT
jgi:uncharacterized protein YutE (UPF0331/DUF86 family)